MQRVRQAIGAVVETSLRAGFILAMVLLVVATVACLAIVCNLPSVQPLARYEARQPLRVLTADGYLIGEFGEERRIYVPVEQLPPLVKQAILAAEDDRFQDHRGVDPIGLARAAWANVVHGSKQQGGSTITMQVARNIYLSSEKSWGRKLSEIFLALKIEANLSKDQIFEIYVNQIYMGQHVYGFGAAAQTYFGKSLRDLTLAECALLAAVPKAPSAANPAVNAPRARERQMYVLKRMRERGFVTDEQFAQAAAERVDVRRGARSFAVHAEYVAELARQMAFDRYGEAAYTSGLTVVTTIVKADQQAAYAAVRQGLFEYDRRHGYRGALRYVTLGAPGSTTGASLEEALRDEIDSDDVLTAIVLEASAKKVVAHVRGARSVAIEGHGLDFARPMLDPRAPPERRLSRGAIIHVQESEKGWRIVQLPEAEAALVAARPLDGAVRALVGGFDFRRGQFNHVTQAWRQPGSSFKPFVYSAALEKGYTPFSVVDDEPITIAPSQPGQRPWIPKNYDGRYEGPMPLRTALAKSKNVVSVRLLQAIGTPYVRGYLSRFGFDADKHPDSPALALGSGAVTPWQMLGAYCIFANGGFRVEPYLVKHVLSDSGKVLWQATPAFANEDGATIIDGLAAKGAPRVLERRIAADLDSMLQDVVRDGTAKRALSLNRKDLAGKTGTTNDYVDAWFCGYQPELVAVAWMGYDRIKSLGAGETGGAAALPIWTAYMGPALARFPETRLAVLTPGRRL
jgi:penicillin-binding protein 1A